jgi:Mg-chelatase subunit ChlD
VGRSAARLKPPQVLQVLVKVKIHQLFSSIHANLDTNVASDSMEYERLPSGIFFDLRQQDIHVEPAIHSLSRRDPRSDPFVPNLLPSVESERSGLQEHREFRLASASIAKDDDRRYLPLLEVSVDVNVVATISRTRLTQTFSNHSNIAIKEATYCFPLYDGSAVIAFLCWIGNNKRLEGKVKPKEAAKAEFLEAVNRQHAAVLLEEITPEVFETCLGNIPPQATVKVEITYINELKADLGGNGVLVTIPTSVAPRYGTPPVGYTHGSASRSTVTPAENGLGIQVEVFTPVPIHKLESRTHPISVELGHPTVTNSIRDLAPASPTPKFDPRKARATLSDRATTLAKDFVLLILAEDRTILASRALLEPHPSLSDRSALMVTINPQELFPSGVVIDKVKAEIIFVADRSGSMRNKIGALISAMRVFLKSIPQSCYLNICSFGSSHSLLWPESRQYTQENLDLATQHVTHSFTSDMGGTELLSALRHVVEKRNARQEMTTEVIVLTDGEVWDTEQVIKFVQETRTKTEERVRFFALGIGDAVSHRLVEGIGRQGGGFAEVVAVDTGGRWESRVIRMLKGALMPSTWQCEITLREENETFSPTSGEPTSTEGVVLNDMLIPQPPILQAPNRIPPLHTFLRSSVYFLVEPQVLGQTKSITVQAVASSGERAKLDIPLEQVESQPPTIHHLAGKALMNDLEIGQSWMHVDKYQKYKSKDPVAFEQAVQQEAEKVGIKWCIAGKWTSFVAVDNNDQVEHNARIYRAGRCELADLTRQRWVTRQPTSLGLPMNTSNGLSSSSYGGYGDARVRSSANDSRPYDKFLVSDSSIVPLGANARIKPIVPSFVPGRLPEPDSGSSVVSMSFTSANPNCVAHKSMGRESKDVENAESESRLFFPKLFLWLHQFPFVEYVV